MPHIDGRKGFFSLDSVALSFLYDSLETTQAPIE